MSDINHFNLKSFDLNLLLAFDALMQEGSVTRAAAKLKVGQPAMSHSLGTLRVLFQDELFIRESRALRPTARALSLAERVRQTLELAQSALSFRETFIPGTETRTFRIGLPADLEALLLPSVMAHARRDAPGIKILSRYVENGDLTSALDNGIIDLAISYGDEVASWHKQEELYHERFVCCYSPKFFSPTLDRDTYLKGAHAMLSKTEHLEGCLKEVLRRNQLELNVVSSCPNLATLLLMVSKVPILATLPSRVTMQHASLFGLKVCELPLDFGSSSCSMISLARTNLDPGLAWLRKEVRTAAEEFKSNVIQGRIAQRKPASPRKDLKVSRSLAVRT
jgi:LysR family transcriptional activator of mexEF-oprN operon